jgi:hypothetical protein
MKSFERLPPVKKEIAVAKRAIAAMRARENLEDGPTPERLARAGKNYSVNEHNDRVVEMVSPDGRASQDTIASKHIRVTDAPFDRLASRCLLAPKDTDKNRVLATAGERYRELWYISGLGPIRAQDLTREGDRVSIPWAPFQSERQASARLSYRRAREALHTEHRAVLDQVLLAEVDLATAGRNASGRVQETAAVAIAVDRIACACYTLAVHFGMLAVSTI